MHISDFPDECELDESTGEDSDEEHFFMPPTRAIAGLSTKAVIDQDCTYSESQFIFMTTLTVLRGLDHRFEDFFHLIISMNILPKKETATLRLSTASDK